MLTDKQIIQELLNGNQAVYSHLVARYQDYMYTVCLNILKNKGEAEEATQDTFIKAYKAIGNYKQEAKLSSWLYKIAYRTSLDLLRKRKHTLDIDEVSYGIADTVKDANNQLVDSELKAQLMQAIMELDGKEASVIRLFYLEEQSIKEVAVITNLSTSNVKVLLFRARKKLGVLIKEKYTEVEDYLN